MLNVSLNANTVQTSFPGKLHKFYTPTRAQIAFDLYEAGIFSEMAKVNDSDGIHN